MLEGYQRIVRGHGLLLLTLAGVAIAGALLARARLRLAILWFLTAAVALFAAPTAGLVYAPRYALPPIAPLVAAAALAGWVVFSALDRRRGARAR